MLSVFSNTKLKHKQTPTKNENPIRKRNETTVLSKDRKPKSKSTSKRTPLCVCDKTSYSNVRFGVSDFFCSLLCASFSFSCRSKVANPAAIGIWLNRNRYLIVAAFQGISATKEVNVNDHTNTTKKYTTTTIVNSVRILLCDFRRGVTRNHSQLRSG